MSDLSLDYEASLASLGQLLCTSESGNWSNAEIDAVQAVVAAEFADAPDQPTIHVVTGLALVR